MDGNLSRISEISGGLSSEQELKGELSLKETQNITGQLTIPPNKRAPSYPEITDKPSINNEIIEGDKLSKDYHLQDKMDAATIAEIEAILYLD